MKKVIAISILFIALFIASFAFAKEIPYTQEDRDRLIRVEAKLEAMEKRLDSFEKRFDSEIKQLREDMNSQFNRLTNIMLGILGAFAALLGGTIWFALWDRRTMIRPFEDKVKKIEDDIAENRSKLHALIDALKSLSKTDEKVTEVLKKFNLL